MRFFWRGRSRIFSHDLMTQNDRRNMTVMIHFDQTRSLFQRIQDGCTNIADDFVWIVYYKNYFAPQ